MVVHQAVRLSVLNPPDIGQLESTVCLDIAPVADLKRLRAVGGTVVLGSAPYDELQALILGDLWVRILPTINLWVSYYLILLFAARGTTTAAETSKAGGGGSVILGGITK